MPTGYTAKIAEGISFRTFAMDCARAFGACIELRDSPGGGDQIPQAFEPSSYNSDRLRQCQAELEALERMSDAELTAKAEAEHAESVASNEKWTSDRTALRAKYEAMLSEAERWKPPTPNHEGLAKFMAEQIRESIRFDCGDYTPEVAPLLGAEQWRNKERARLLKDCAYHADAYAKEVERTRSRNEWVAALRASLTEPTP